MELKKKINKSLKRFLGCTTRSYDIKKPEEFGLKVLNSCRISAAQLEAARRIIKRKLNRVGILQFCISLDLPVTAKPNEVRMGKGKGGFSYLCAAVPAGRLVFRLIGVSEILARKALLAGGKKLPSKSRFIFYNR